MGQAARVIVSLVERNEEIYQALPLWKRFGCMVSLLMVIVVQTADAVNAGMFMKP